MEDSLWSVMRTIAKFVVKVLITAIIFTIVGLILIWYFQVGIKELYTRVSGPPLNSEARKQIQDESRVITDSYGAYGSGCEMVPGFVFTSRHLVEDTILDASVGMKVSLTWSDKIARVYSYSNTTDDYAVVTTTPPGTKFPQNVMKFSAIPVKEGQILHTFSSPGDIPDLYQKLEVVKITPASKDRLQTLTFKADYVQNGISGGCVVDENGDFVGIIKNKREYSDPKIMDFGEITVIKSVQ